MVPETECTAEGRSRIYEGNSASTSECEATEALNLDLYETRKMSEKEIITEIGS